MTTVAQQALLTDLYQLTMAYGYWKAGRADDEAVFNLFFRKAPFGSGYTVACGLAPVIDFIEGFRFQADDLEYLAGLTGNDGERLFEKAFLDYLGELRLAVTVHGIPEGTVVFPHEPLLRIQGPILHCQLLETALLNIVNFDTLVATKAARVCLAAQGDPVLEFGLRRAQGRDGALAASRAAHVGGCAATSNVLAGKCFGIPVRGTHAHSWVMSFDSELEAFQAYAEVMPNNCVFLVDTYDTIEGVHNAIAVARDLRQRGKELVGIRLDSGDLAWLSTQARKLLDEAGFPKAAIVASNDLDEHLIQSLKNEGAAIGVWGVGTKLVTAFEQPALGGVYKLGAYRDERGAWHEAIKLSEQPIKISNPGVLQVRRLRRGDEYVGDVIFDSEHGCESPVLHDIEHPLQKPVALAYDHAEDLLTTVIDRGRLLATPDLEAARTRAARDLVMLSPRTKRFLNPQPYPVGLDSHVHRRKQQLIAEARARHA